MTPSSDPPGDEIRAWIEQRVGPVTAVVDHPAAGRSRSIKIVEVADGVGSLILRGDTDEGPMRHTAFTLQREAALLSALRGRVRVPRCHGVSPDGHAILLEHLAGSATTEFATDAEREQVMRSYVSELATLHAIDPGDLHHPLPTPRPGEPPGLVDLAQYVEAYRRLCRPRDEFEEAIAWLTEHAPPPRRTVSVLHGDTGPGNFLHAEGRLTGLVDFEMAHLGDPEDDLAWVWFRCELLYGDPHTADYLDWYEQVSGRTIDVERWLYYRVLVLARCVASNLFVDDLPTTVPRAGLTRTVPWLHAVLAQAGGPVHDDAASISEPTRRHPLQS